MGTGKKTALVALALLVGAAALLATMSYDATALGSAVVDAAREATGLRLEAGSARFRPLRGLELEGVRAGAAFPGGRYDVTLSELSLEHRLGPMLRGRVEVDRLVLAQPRVVLTLGGEPRRSSAPPDTRSSPRGEDDAPAPESHPSVASPRLDVSLSEIRLEDGSFAIRDRTEAPARLGIEGLDLALASARFDRGALTLLHGIAGAGELRIRALRFARTEVTSISGRIETEGGRTTLSDLAFQCGGASFETSRLELDVNSIPFRYRLTLEGAGELPGILGGRAKLRFEAAGFGTSSRAVSGEGVLELAAGSLPDAPWARALDAATDVDLIGRAYAANRIAFRVASNRIVLEPFRLEAASYLIEAEGSVDLEGPVDLRLTVAEGASSERRFRLTGTFALPELEPDQER